MSTSHPNQQIDDIAFRDLFPRATENDESVAPSFAIVPKCEQKRTLSSGEQPWRVVLRDISNPHHWVELEIHGDTIIGADPEPEDKPDVNLSRWQAHRLGVSQQHVLLRPSNKRLFIMDLKSVNGTDINGLPLGLGWAYALRDGDLISLGRLHLRVQVVQRPT